jgi:hypothetical protein
MVAKGGWLIEREVRNILSVVDKWGWLIEREVRPRAEMEAEPPEHSTACLVQVARLVAGCGLLLGREDHRTHVWLQVKVHVHNQHGGFVEV